MTDTAPAGNIYVAIPAILSEIGAIAKDKKNLQQGYQYRGVDDVYNAVNPLLAKHGVFVTSEVLEHQREERRSAADKALIYTILKVRFTFYAIDASNVSSIVMGEGMDSGDKSCNKAMSVAFKYALFQLLCIPTEVVDPDADSHEVKAKGSPAPAKEAAPDPPSGETKTVAGKIEDWAEKSGGTPEKPWQRLMIYVAGKPCVTFDTGFIDELRQAQAAGLMVEITYRPEVYKGTNQRRILNVTVVKEE